MTTRRIGYGRTFKQSSKRVQTLAILALYCTSPIVPLMVANVNAVNLPPPPPLPQLKSPYDDEHQTLINNEHQSIEQQILPSNKPTSSMDDNNNNERRTIEHNQDPIKQKQQSNSDLDEQILQTIDAISKGKFCRASTGTAGAASIGSSVAAAAEQQHPIGTFPSSNQNNNHHHSNNVGNGGEEFDGPRRMNEREFIRYHVENHHEQLQYRGHGHYPLPLFMMNITEEIQNNNRHNTHHLNVDGHNSNNLNIETIRSRFRHMQINLPKIWLWQQPYEYHQTRPWTPSTQQQQQQMLFHEALIDNEKCRRIEKCVDLLAKVLADYDPLLDQYRLLNQTIINAPLVEPNIYRLSIAWLQNDDSISMNPDGRQDKIRLEFLQCNQSEISFSSKMNSNNNNNNNKNENKCEIYSLVETVQVAARWLTPKLVQTFEPKRQFRVTKNESTEWSSLFYDCHDHRWFISYHSLILQSINDDGYYSDPFIPPLTNNNGNNNSTTTDEDDRRDDTINWFRVKGVISADVDVTDTDINQCGPNIRHHYFGTSSTNHHKKTSATTSNNNPQHLSSHNYHHHHHHHHYHQPLMRTILNLHGTHKCHNKNSECIFLPGHGMFRGGYQCQCKIGFHSTVADLGPTFNGSLMEQSYQDKHDGTNPAYDYMFTCERCQPGCEQCTDNSPCLSSYNWAFRISLLTITIFCIIFVFVLVLNVYRYRKLKVIKLASPIFLCITLLGCVCMYLESVVIFPVMDTSTCVLTKWTRNFGFCLTYSSLLLKTWRVSLTYRVKSAHKIKLTDKQLLQWLFPILLVMAIYLGAWTISDTPQPYYMVDWNHLKFKQCDLNWWDYSLTIGEFLFLLWGIKVCYNVRNAESLFDEAKYITWAIYNITIVNMLMLLIHLTLPNSGPDIKYFFGFLRTQLSTTTTVVLIFGPKFYRVIKGEGDLWHPRLQARGIIMAETYAFNGIGLAHEETTDLYQENDDLKREIQKLAAQLEIMKLCQMEFRNRHLTSHSTSSKFSKMQHQQSQSD